MIKPLFSVIMPIYNRAEFLKKSISSVLHQTYNNFELVCIDDGSKDNSLAVIEELQRQNERIKIISFPQNMGRCNARNAGIKSAIGDWVCFLDSDDFYYEYHLQTFFNLIKKFPCQSAFATDQAVNGKKVRYHNKKLYKPNCEISFRDNLYCDPIQLNQLCYNKEKINVCFPDLKMPIAEDWLFMRQLTLQTTVLKADIITNEVTDHSSGTMNSTEASEVAKWNFFASEYFIKSNNVPEDWEKEIWSHAFLLSANILLSSGNKKEALKYLSGSFKYLNTYKNLLFYKAAIKLLLPKLKITHSQYKQ